MAESSLTLGWPELKQAVGKFLGMGSTITDWTASQVIIIEAVVQSGYRRVLYPPALNEELKGYEWSFLRPTTTLSIVVDDGDYDLPDSFGKLAGEFHYAADEHKASIRRIPLSALLDMRSHSDMNGYPNFVAIRYKSSEGDDGQRQEALFYPEPDASYTLTYSFEAYAGKLSDAAPYPLGGMQMSELYLESCLAVAESRHTDEVGQHTAVYQAMLLDAISRDRKRGARSFGAMGEPSSLTSDEKWRRGGELYEGAYSITYDGEQI